MQGFSPLVEAVQKNCHISDARHARGKTLCTYLLEMREYFRWEYEVPHSQQPAKDELSDWLTRREALWDELEDAPFESLPVSGKNLDPFDIDAINGELMAHGLVYGAGVGRFHKPHFFLGRLLRLEQREGLTIVVSECEYARDITAFGREAEWGHLSATGSAAALVARKIEVWGLKKSDGALKSALECYGFNVGEEAALDRMQAHESETVIPHEIGELAADRILGAGWPEMMTGFTQKRPEILARAVRDNLADCLSTLPASLEKGVACSLHFYFANLEVMRRALFPNLAKAYQRWRDGGDLSPLRAVVASGREHWANVGMKLVNGYRAERDNTGSCNGQMERLEIESIF